MPLMQPSRFQLIKIDPLAVEATKLLNFPNYHFNIHQKIKIPWCLSQIFITYRPDVFTVMYPYQGLAGISCGIF
jgi:hypothetical protein